MKQLLPQLKLAARWHSTLRRGIVSVSHDVNGEIRQNLCRVVSSLAGKPPPTPGMTESSAVLLGTYCLAWVSLGCPRSGICHESHSRTDLALVLAGGSIQRKITNAPAPFEIVAHTFPPCLAFGAVLLFLWNVLRCGGGGELRAPGKGVRYRNTCCGHGRQSKATNDIQNLCRRLARRPCPVRPVCGRRVPPQRRVSTQMDPPHRQPRAIHRGTSATTG